MMNDTKQCPFCAETIAAGAEKCPFCGEALTASPAAADGTKQCPFCAETIAAGAEKCPLCGETLTAAPEPVPPPRPQAPPKFRPRRSRPIYGVRPILFDNPVFRVSRQAVYMLDDAIFNHAGREGYYQPTRYALVLPFFGGIAAASYIFFNSFGEHSDEALTQNVRNAAVVLIAVNVLLNCGNVFVLRSWVKKIFYPVFIAVVSGIFLGATTFVCAWLYVLAIIILGIWLLLIGLGVNFSSGGGGRGGGGSGEKFVQKMWVDDGSVTGLTLTRDGSIGDWRGNDGHTYTEDMCGNLHQK